MTQEVKNFSSGVLSKGGLIQKEEEREAKRQQEKLRKETEEKNAAEAVARRNKAREERAIEKAEQEAQAKVKQLADEERRRKAEEKAAQDEVARLQVVAAKEAARLERQKDLERRLAEKAALQQEEEAKRKTQHKSVALLDSLSKEPETEGENPAQELEAEEESVEPVFSPVKGEVLVPAEIPSLASNPQPGPIVAQDISELLPPPVVLTVEAEPQPSIQVESGKDLIERVLSATEETPKEQVEEATQSNRSENRFQKMANTNRDLAKENEVLKSKVEDLLDKLHSYEIEGELVGSMMESVERNKKEKWSEKPGHSYLNKDQFSVVKEAKQEMLKYLSTRQGEVDHCYKSQP
jgi:hypothetical protein